MIRRGLGRGLGRGYYNLVPKDPYIHSLSAKGIKSYLYKKAYVFYPLNQENPTKLEGYFIESDEKGKIDLRVTDDKGLGIDRIRNISKKDLKKLIILNAKKKDNKWKKLIKEIKKEPFDIRDTRMFEYKDIVKKDKSGFIKVKTKDGLVWNGLLIKDFPKTKEVEVYLF